MAKAHGNPDRKKADAEAQSPRNRAADQVLAQLVGMILSGECAPGGKLPPERMLAERLGVNRTTLREALRRLETMGLINVRQGGGITVQDPAERATLEYITFLAAPDAGPDRNLVLSLEQARHAIAAHMVRQAAARINQSAAERLEQVLAAFPGEPGPDLLSGQWDFRMFMEIARASGNMVFVCYLNSMKDTFGVLHQVYAGMSEEQFKRMAGQYAKLVRAISAGRKKKSAKLLDAIMQEQSRALMAALDAVPRDKND